MESLRFKILKVSRLYRGMRGEESAGSGVNVKVAGLGQVVLERAAAKNRLTAGPRGLQ